MAKKRKTQKPSKTESLRRLAAREEMRKVDQELAAVMHELQVYQEQVRAQNEQLLEVKRSLEQSRDRYADLYDFAPIAYITMSVEGIIKEINLTGSVLLGSERSHMIGMPLTSYVPDEDRMLFFDHMRRCRAGEGEAKEGVRTELRLVSRKSGPFPAQLFTRSSAPAEGVPVVFRTIVTDLTEQKSSEEEKRQLLLREQAARAAAEAKDEFLAVVSHELRTPLTAILLWAKLLRSGHVTENQREVALGAIEHSASAQQQLIEDLLDISRLVSGRLRLEIRDTDIIPMIEGAIDTVRPAAELKGVQLETDLNPRLGIARIDPDRVRQVVWNLVHNAVKFTPSGGKVSVSLIRGRDSISLEVKDTGQGIARDFLPHVFERFRQADTGLTRTHGGLGLGLAIARQLVELHGGSIRVDSAGVGRGATFTVELPAGKIPHKPVKLAEPPRGALGKFVAGPVLQDLRILLVEDDDQTRNVVLWLLQQCRGKIIAVSSAAEALRQFEQTLELRRAEPAPAFDLLISDIAMPDQDGYDLIRQVRKLEKSAGVTAPLPAIALTAYVRERHRAQALAAGFNEYIPKPIDPEALIRAALRLLNRRMPAEKKENE